MGGGVGTTIPFLDTRNMSGPTQAIFLLAVFGLVFGALYLFYELLVVAPEREAEAKRAKKDQQRRKKDGKEKKN